MEKICKKCNISRDLISFNKDNRNPNGRRNVCKFCKSPEALEKIRIYKKEYSKKYRENNREYFQDYIKKYLIENSNTILENKKEYYKNNREKILEYYHKNKEVLAISNKKWRDNNKEELKKYKREYESRRKSKDKLYKLSRSIRSLISISFKNKYTLKSKKTIEILGCSFEEFKLYIEGKFDINMNWENYGTYWHLDHMIPISWAENEEELIKLNHYTNYQPLYWEENLRKGNRYESN